MTRWLTRLLGNLDGILALILAMAAGILGLLNVTSLPITENAILATLAVMAFSLLRDRWNAESTKKSLNDATDANASALEHIQGQLTELPRVDRTVQRIQNSMDGLVDVRTLRGPDIAVAFAEARNQTDRWMFRGGTGTYTRAVTLPECIANARRERRALLVRLEIIDPTNVALCRAYSRFRLGLNPNADAAGEIWTVNRIMREACATLLAACWHQQRFQFLDIDVALSFVMSTFRFDISASRVIITQDDPQFPTMVVGRGSPLYDGYVNELRTTFAQARHVDLDAGSRVVLSDEPTVEEVRELFQAIGVSLPDEATDDTVTNIIVKAIHAKDPYL